MPAQGADKRALGVAGAAPAGTQSLPAAVGRSVRERSARYHPSLAKRNRLLKPVTMSLFGMVNCPTAGSGQEEPLSRAEYADLVTQIIVDGIAGLGSDTRTRIRLRSKVTSL